jgi:hypothetical protein
MRLDGSSSLYWIGLPEGQFQQDEVQAALRDSDDGCG